MDMVANVSVRVTGEQVPDSNQNVEANATFLRR